MTDDELPTGNSDPVAFHFGASPLKLAGWTAHKEVTLARDEAMIRLMVGDVMLGRLRRTRERPDVDAHMGHASPPCGFDVPDYGLRAFAELNGLSDLAVVAESDAAGPERHPLRELARSEIAVGPLGSRLGVRDSLRLADVWLGSSRDLSLRFDGAAQVARSVDAYQCMTTGERQLIKIGSELPVGGGVSVATIKLLNPFVPVLLIFNGEDGAIDAIDILPFPSLVRGGLHAAERLIIGDGSDDLRDTATVSAQLLHALLRKTERPADHVATILLDPAIRTGREPVLDPDLLAWISVILAVGVEMGAEVPDFIGEVVRKHASSEVQSGHRLHLPAESIPTISALVQPLPGALPAQKVVGPMGVVDVRRHGRIFSVWQPSLGAWLDGLQLGGHEQAAPMLEVVADVTAAAKGELAIQWPLALALREMPTRVAIDSPFEVSSELPIPLLRNGSRLDAVQICVIIHCQRNNQSILPLLESLVRQEAVGGLDVIMVTPPGEVNSEVLDFLTSRLSDRHSIVRQPFGRGRLEQIVAVRDHIAHDHVLIIDGDIVLPDPRTLATLISMLDGEKVETVGCLIRHGQGKSARQGAGYAPAGLDLRGIPSFSFGVIDPRVFTQPMTFPVIANSLAVLVTRKLTIDHLDACGSTPMRPEVDDLLFGIQVIERGGLNLSSTIVSAHSLAEPARDTSIPISIPYRLTPEAIARLTASSTIVQTIQ